MTRNSASSCAAGNTVTSTPAGAAAATVGAARAVMAAITARILPDRAPADPSFA